MSTKRHVLFTALTRIAANLSSGVTAIIIAQHMGAAALGLFGLLRALPALTLLLTELGISTAAPYLINNRGHAAQSILSAIACAAHSASLCRELSAHDWIGAFSTEIPRLSASTPTNTNTQRSAAT